MYIEREKKYIVDSTQARQLIAKSLSTIGVVQWYFEYFECFDNHSSLNKNFENTCCRVRYTFDRKGNEEWVVAYKGELRDNFTRTEEEYKLIPSEKVFEALKSKPVVAKVRHFLLFTPAEIVLDEFVNLDKPYNVEVSYLAEIETYGDFEVYEKQFGLANPLPLEEFKMYQNKNLAIVSCLSLEDIIKIVREKLLTI